MDFTVLDWSNHVLYSQSLFLQSASNCLYPGTPVVGCQKRPRVDFQRFEANSEEGAM